jgi:hypothetical protein
MGRASGGSLSCGLFLLLCTMPRNPDPERRKKPILEASKTSQPSDKTAFIEEDMRKSKLLYMKFTGYKYAMVTKAAKQSLINK